MTRATNPLRYRLRADITPQDVQRMLDEAEMPTVERPGRRRLALWLALAVSLLAVSAVWAVAR